MKNLVRCILRMGGFILLIVGDIMVINRIMKPVKDDERYLHKNGGQPTAVFYVILLLESLRGYQLPAIS